MITVYSTPDCRYCAAAKALLDTRGHPYKEIDLYRDADAISQFKTAAPGAKTVPQITVGKTLIGGFDDLTAMIDTSKFKQLMEPDNG